jgi:hypothetical protein
MKAALLKLLTAEVPVFIFGGVFLILITMITMLTVSHRITHKQRDIAVENAARWELAHKESEISNASLRRLLSIQEESIDTVAAMCERVIANQSEAAAQAIEEAGAIKKELDVLRDSLDSKPGGLTWRDLHL